MKGLQIIFCLMFILLNSNGFSQNKSDKNEFTFMFYNAENFFDSENDSITNDDEFMPDGDRRWSQGRMHAKAEKLGKVILAAGKWNPPVFVGLCEIENLEVLELLTKLAPINTYHYKIVQKDSPDLRGIDVALIYRPEFFRPFSYKAIPVVDPSDHSFKTRDILLVSGVINGCDTLHVFVNHWPSRYGGIMETEKYRMLAAEILKANIRSLKETYSNPKIICMGDFNDSPKDVSLVKGLEAREINNPDISGELVNLSSRWLQEPIKTIKGQYSWEVFDQWIVSDQFIEERGCFEFTKAEIFAADFLLEPDMKFGGVKPKRTYVGYKYQDGFSDHLPVLLRFKLLDH
jgi:hypothetical protein